MSRYRVKYGLLLLFLLALGTAGCGPAFTPTSISTQPPPTVLPTAAPQAHWITYTTADGLADNRVEALALAPDGALWVGTRGGVSRFDGTHWTSYTAADGLADNDVTTIAAAPDGAFWFGTLESGVTLLDGSTWTHYTEEEGLSFDYVEEIAVAADGSVWVATMSGVSAYDGESWWTARDVLADWSITAVAAAPDGAVWIGTLGGLTRFDGGWTSYTAEEGLRERMITCLAVEPSGVVWAGTFEGGAVRFDPNAPAGAAGWTSYTQADGLADDVVLDVAHSAATARTYFATGSGVSEFDGIHWTTYTTDDGLADNTVAAVLVEPSGVVWFGTFNGLSRYVPAGVPLPTPPAGAPPTRVPPAPTVAPTPTRPPTPTPWPTATSVPTTVPTPLAEIFHPLAAVDEVLPGWVVGLRALPDGSLWLITEEGVARFVEDTVTVSTVGFPGNLVGVDDAGRVWVSSEDASHVQAWDGASWTLYNADAGWTPIAEEWLQDVGYGGTDSLGQTWLVTRQDVRAFDGASWTIYTPDDMDMGQPDVELMPEFVLAHVESRDEIWVGECDWGGPGPFGGQGARWFDGEVWQGADSPVASGCVTVIEEDALGRVWLGLNADLWRYDPAADEWARFSPPEVAPDGNRPGFVYELALDPQGDPWPLMATCGGASCFGGQVRYHVQEGRWILEAEADEIGRLNWAVDATGTPWLFWGDQIYRGGGDRWEVEADLSARHVAVDAAGRIWFVARYGGRDVLWVLEP